MTSRPHTRLVALAALCAVAIATPANAGDPNGTWLTEKGDARMRVAPCDGALCATIVWLKTPTDPASGKPVADVHNPDLTKRSRPLLGVRIAPDMKPSGTPDKWVGHFYNPDDGKTYDGQLVLIDATTMRAEGCLLIFCSGETWKRVE